ncbi:hypothetical protein [Rhizobium sp. 2MFCol3.1]|uniref:hypothetical protein n=1 Tax=Rhizobium sp. 2MFCol3.1 TaxID=1246459 RepID=UPI00037F213B|nr:hypothetical protein [Rhizobium sp. 2MFCol3.1]
MIGAIFTFLYRAIGFGGLAFLGLYVYDWGIPGASRIPYLSSIPIIGDLTTGRAHSFAADQVKLATAAQTAIYNARIEKMVSAAELTAANATLARERALRRMADEAAAEADKRAIDAKRGEEAKAAEIERLRAEADQDAELSRPNDKDRSWSPKR